MLIELPTTIETERLLLRHPKPSDAREVFENYANDIEAVKYMSWHRHTKPGHSEQFVEFCIAQWEQGNGGAYMITDRESGSVIGSTGLELETRFRATTGYILSRHYWGRGLATEALQAIVGLTSSKDVQRLYAYCHHEHLRSASVMEKCGFQFEGRLRNHMEFPNLSPGVATDVILFSWIPKPGA